jgi:hypothetical protein
MKYDMFLLEIHYEELTSLYAEQKFKTSAFTIRVNVNVTWKIVSVRLTHWFFTQHFFWFTFFCIIIIIIIIIIYIICCIWTNCIFSCF